tara:strand:- start:48 stop:3620 length:3573 start_codon:yes stop_codon:yes gene_type:complete
MNHYEKRYITHFGGNNLSSLFDDDVSDLTLMQSLNNNSKIVLLGNPGIGKTTELKNLFSELWKVKDTSGSVPLFIDLKYFRKGDNFYDFIQFKEWKELPQVIFILDGLDEIVDIQDFISTFETFIQENSDINIKYVISCRTNIYDKYLIQITDFEIYFLKSLSFNQAKSILNNKYKIVLPFQYNNDEFIDALNSPFFLDLFAEYYIEKGKYPESYAEIWDLYINQIIERDKEKFKKRGIINKHRIIHSLKTVAVVNEIMQRNFTTDEDLYKILNENYEDLIENSLIIKDNETNKWSFIHRQIQEYLVAKSLIDVSFNEILDFIKIKNIDAIHPSIFNSLAFTIDLLDPKKDIYNQLITWLKKNQVDVLFKSDSNRFNDKLKADVFQSYFKQECIDKTLWINTNKTFEVKEIAEFGNNRDNFLYLKKIISDSSYHFRVRYSAIELISYFDIPIDLKDDFKSFLLSLLNLKEIEAGIKSQIIKCIIYQELHNDKIYFDLIFESQHQETNKEINRSILSLIETQLDIDEYYSYIKEEFLRAHNLLPRNDSDEVIRGNQYTVESLVLKLQNPNNFIEIAKYYFDSNINITDYNNITEQFINKCIFFIKNDDSFLNQFLDSVKKELKYLVREDLFYKIIKDSNEELKTIEHLLNKDSFKDTSYFIAKIVNEESINLLVEFIISNTIDADEVERFRNFIGNINSRNVAKILNDKLIEKGFIFKEAIVTEEQSIENKKKYKLQLQDNIDILFNSERFLKEIKKVFIVNEEIDNQALRKIENKWYEENGSWNFINSKISFLSHLLFQYRYQTINYASVEKAFEDKSIILSKLQSLIERYKSSLWEYNLSIEQKKLIEEWVKNIASKINFDEIIKLHSIGSYSYHKDFLKLKTVFYFKQLLNLDLPQNFLLESIRFFELDKSSEPDDNFLQLKKDINNDVVFNNKIVENIKEGNLFSFSLSKHIAYAIQEKLEASYKHIREYFKEGGDSIHNESRKMESYVLASGDINVLKEVCVKPDTWVYWSAIGILVKNNWEEEFCINKSLEYLKSNEDKFKSDALNVLLQLNDNNAIDYLLKFLKDNSLSSLRFLNNKNFYNIKNYENLDSLYFIFHSENIDRFDSHFARSFYNNLILSLIEKEDGSFSEIMKILNKIREQIKKDKSDLFYINLLINDVQNAYINSNSKPFELKKAILKANKILN